MGRKGSAAVIILVILVVITLSLAGAGYYLYQKEHTKNVALEAKIEEVQEKQRVTERKLQDSEKMATELKFRLQEADTRISKLNTDLQAEKSSRQEALAKLELLRIDLEQQKSLRMELENKLTAAQTDMQKTQGQLKQLEVRKSELETKVADLEVKTQGIELGKIVVSPDATVAVEEQAMEPTFSAVEEKMPASKPQGREGKILVLNRDYNFAVINLGSKDGIELGNIFSIYHNNKYVGDVKVEKVHDSMAAAGFLATDTKDKASEGDKVIQKLR